MQKVLNKYKLFIWIYNIINQEIFESLSHFSSIFSNSLTSGLTLKGARPASSSRSNLRRNLIISSEKESNKGSRVDEIGWRSPTNLT